MRQNYPVPSPFTCQMRKIALLASLLVVLHFVAFRSDGGGDVSFRNGVMAVLSKAGCNQGSCHGNFKGKGGLRLSLRGESPELDFMALAESSSQRRLNRANPLESLLLKKPTEQMGHEGGKRFAVDSPEFLVLRSWIEQGAVNDLDAAPQLESLEVTPAEKICVAPDWRVGLKAVARFSDNSVRDVTRWAVYEPFGLEAEVNEDGVVTAEREGEITIAVRYLHLQVPVRLAFVNSRPGWEWRGPEPRNLVDRHVFAKLRKLRINPSGPCADSVFVRRAYLDLLGRSPTADEAKAYAQDGGEQGEKRARLIDHLLAQPEFADFWALKWSDLLKVEEKVLDSRGVKAFHGWIRQRFAEGMPMDAFIRAILTGTGSTYQNPPSNFYRALRDPTARAEAAAQVFLGTRLQCARCHNHPYEKWTQNQYYRLAAAFDGIHYEILTNERRDGLDKNNFNGEQLVVLSSRRTQTHPRDGRYPRPGFLGIEPDHFDLEPLLARAPSTAMNRYAAGQAFYHSLRQPRQDRDRLNQLAAWMTSPENELFARAQVNRIWFHLMGRGIVEPVDDLRSTNPPVNPALLRALSEWFVENGHSLRKTVKLIASSRTYGLSSVPDGSNQDDATNFSRALIQRLSAEQLIDSLHQVLEVPLELKEGGGAARAVQVPGVPIAGRVLEPGSCEQFLKVFGKPERLLHSDLERSNETSLAQVLELTSGGTMQRLLSHPENRIAQWLETGLTNEEIASRSVWWTLARPPTAQELEAFTSYLQNANSKRLAIEDLLWSLVNSKAFLLRH